VVSCETEVCDDCCVDGASDVPLCIVVIGGSVEGLIIVVGPSVVIGSVEPEERDVS
jgi:hypothetical protein